MNLSKCRRCGVDVVAGAHATNKRFCSRDCYDTWWSEYRTKHVTRGAVAERIWGKAPVLNLSEAQKAWLAALIDGEGTISIWRERRPKNRSGVRYKAVVLVTNTNLALLDALYQCVDGYACTHNARRANKKHKATFAVYVSRRAIRSLLEQIKPYLVAKRKQADLVLEFCRVMEATPMRASQNHDIFETLCAECQRLNQRGIPATVTSGG